MPVCNHMLINGDSIAQSMRIDFWYWDDLDDEEDDEELEEAA